MDFFPRVLSVSRPINSRPERLGARRTWFGFGFAARFAFDLGSAVFRLGARLFSPTLFTAFTDTPPGAASHQ